MFGATREQLIKRYKEEWKIKPPRIVTAARKGQGFSWGFDARYRATKPITKDGDEPTKVFDGICIHPMSPDDPSLIPLNRLIRRRMQPERIPFDVWVTWRSEPNPEFERLLEKTAGCNARRLSGGGRLSRRHAVFMFVRRGDAISCAKRLVKATRTTKLGLRVVVIGTVWSSAKG